MSDIATLVDRYQAWLKDRTVLKQVNGWTEITTPFLDRHNDYVQIYALAAYSRAPTTSGNLLSQVSISSVVSIDSRLAVLMSFDVNGFNDGLLVHAWC